MIYIWSTNCNLSILYWNLEYKTLLKLMLSMWVWWPVSYHAIQPFHSCKLSYVADKCTYEKANREISTIISCFILFCIYAWLYNVPYSFYLSKCEIVSASVPSGFSSFMSLTRLIAYNKVRLVDFPNERVRI